MGIRNIAVFCASADGVQAAYRAEAERLGRALAERGVGLIYGGAKVGLMPEVLVDLEVAHQGLTELHVTSTMHTRKALMGERADAFLILPGGFGTFEELFEVLAWQTLKLHQKPIVLLNTLGFYDPMLRFLDHCVEQGMLKAKNRAILLAAETVEEALGLVGV
jgi:uncharacterized protein (TIGR00730 family)